MSAQKRRPAAQRIWSRYTICCLLRWRRRGEGHP